MGGPPIGRREWSWRAIAAALRRLLGVFRPRPVDLGRMGEAAAARYLARRGLRILARNVRSRTGEIDLVAIDGRTLVLVEVKALIEGGRDPLGKIDRGKVRRIRRAAARCRRDLGSGFESCRIDGVVVEFGPSPSRWRPAPVAVRWYPALHPIDEG